jgi:Dolichyl-phosphate-mannose-protein mannosyltransferase
MHRRMQPTARRFGAAFGLFVLSFAIRSLYAVDLSPTMYTRSQPGTRMAIRYDDTALGMLRGDGILFPRVVDRRRTGLIARPPGYSYVLKLIYAALGRSFFIAQLVQNLAGAACCVLLFLLASALLGQAAGVAAGLVAAISPHLAYASNLIAADALSALPLLGACLLLAAPPPGGTPRLRRAVLAGALLGTSVWLRPNLSLMGPCLALTLLATTRDRPRAVLPLAALIGAAALVIAPITLRNYRIFGELVPVSINGGLTLWEGVAEAGGQAFGAFTTDLNVAAEEARRYGKPEYAEWWAEPDGIWRDHDRYRRSLEAIGHRPLWYLGAMLGRMGAMVSYSTAEAPLVAAAAPSEASPANGPARKGPSPEAFRLAGHDVPGPRLREASVLAPGRAAAFSRPVVRRLQSLGAVTTLPLALLGLASLVRVRDGWRKALFLSAVPAYYLVLESLFIYEWRVATPMHYGMFALAGAGWMSLGRLLRGRFPATAESNDSPSLS